MRFVKSEGTEELSRALVKALTEAMASNLKTLWIVPGGSNIPVVVEVMSKLPQKDLHRLVVMLSDERYGPIGHVDSNYEQIKQASFLEHDALFTQMLSGSPLPETVAYAEKVMETLLGECGAVVGFFGFWVNGSTAGIMPHSPAIGAETLVATYNDGQFDRITLTPMALRRITHGLVGAFGPEKKEALLKLRDEDLSVDEQPAQLFKQLHNVVIFNDQIGENV